jgi:hypothetical protein
MQIMELIKDNIKALVRDNISEAWQELLDDID